MATGKAGDLRWGPGHCNKNVLCAIDIRVGGTDPGMSDLLELAILPVSHSYGVHQEFKLFHLKMRPSWPVDGKVAGINKEGLQEFMDQPFDTIGGFSMFEAWVERLGLRRGKGLMPLCWDWAFVKPFLKMWMGEENFNHYINPNVRDLQTVLNVVNDRYFFWHEPVPIVHPKRQTLYHRLGVELIDKNSCVAQCKGMVDAYKTLLRGYLPGYATTLATKEVEGTAVVEVCEDGGGSSMVGVG